ncbi:hypothetical protein ONS95_009156 [Cadophora gregata]|uniref:uncharacterized protein n=1 Tax=Cadophora gregata TaxID=51156 RepID=UPI0026DA7B9B|nr:uncharacterized protein ONS95_009156 [Cadophora gregata]KAK0124174.1 hypothetical protein ONS95_009156 [Cadophora gregata]KAK0130506.1 hypothetical protein ONS96_001023 [Cadophora gregata f. sp. sojae]
MDWIKCRWQQQSYKRLELRDQHSNSDITEKNQRQGRHEFSYAVTLVNLLLTILTITIVFVHHNGPRQHILASEECICPETWTDARYEYPGMNTDLKQVTGYSPLLDEVDLTPQPKTLNGAFHSNTTIFMQDPSPAVDAAWLFFSEDIFLTPWTSVRYSGRSLSKSIHFEPDSAGNPGQYIATFDVFHQIHCLNWLRKSVNWEYYYGEEKPTETYLMHQKHCIHMLLQSLMCNADVDMVTFEWMEGHDERVESFGNEEKEDNGGEVQKRNRQDAIPAANFNVHKMCRNFSALVEWAKKNKEEDPVQTRRKLRVPDNIRLNRPEDY